MLSDEKKACILSVMSKPLEQTVQEWLEESGAALELRVARAIQTAGLPVTDTFFYIDSAEAKPREGDLSTVISIRESGEEFKLLVVVECKNSPGTTWVGIRPTSSGGKNQRELADWTAFGTLSGPASDAAMGYLLNRGVVDTVAPCVRLVEPNRKNDPAYDALRQVMASTIGRHKQVSDDEPDHPGHLGIVDDTVALAVVVTTANLFTAELDGDSQLAVERTDRLEVLNPVDWPRRPIIVMNESAFNELVGTLRP